jgi:uncharacterized protein RhaS with RHS repeats
MTPVDLVPGVILYDNANQLLKMVNSPRLTPERVAFFKLTNTLVFLQSLDDDAFPNNGITIPAGIVDLLTGVTLNFETDDEGRFKQGLRVITNHAANNDILSSGAIKPRSYALDHFYTAQNISQRFFTLSTINIDSNNNGNDDTIIVYTYDDNGNKLTVTTTDTADAVVRQSQTSTYDDDGNQLSFMANTAFSGLISKTASTYDDNGNQLTFSRDSVPRNGTFEPAETDTFTYDDNGNQRTIDYQSDGAIEDVSTYDDSGNLSTNGTVETIYYKYTYDTNGNILTNGYDSEGNGFDEADFSTYTYDAKDNLLTLSRTFETYIYTYDDKGNLLTCTLNTSGGIIESETNTYDVNGNLLTSRILRLNQGINLTVTYTYDDNGNLLTYIESQSGTITQNETNTYDVNGNLLTKISLSKTSTYTYDDNNNRVTESYDTDGDTFIDEKVTNTYIESNWSILNII